MVVAVVVGLALRALHWWSATGSPPRTVLLTNAARYDAWAQRITGGNPPLPPFDQPPLYPYLLAATYTLAGHKPEWMLAVQAVADALGCGLIAWMAGRCFGQRAAWAAGLLAAVFGPFIYHTAELLPATFGLALLVAGAACALANGPVTAGLAFATATLMRPESVLAALLVACWAWGRGQRRLSAGIVGAAVAALVGGSVAVSLVAGRPLPYSTGFGLNLWLGNNPSADGVSPFIPRAQEGFAERVRFEAGGDAWAADGRFAAHALRFWRELPGAALQLAVKKLRWTLVDPELPNTSALDWQLSYSAVFAWPLFPLSFGAVWVLACAGAVLLGRKSLAPWPLWAVALATVAVCTVFFTNARFRLPLAPLLLVLAGGGVAEIAGLLQERRRTEVVGRRLLLAGAAALAGAVVAFSNPYRVRDYRIAALDANAGIAERLAGHPARAVEYLRRALAQEAGDEIAWVHLVLAQEQQGDVRGALQSLLDAAERLAEAPDLEQLAASFFTRHGLRLELWQEYRTSTQRGAREVLRRELYQRLGAGSPGIRPPAAPAPVDSAPQKP